LTIFSQVASQPSIANEPWEIYETVNDFGDPQYIAIYRFDSNSGQSYFLAAGCTAGFLEVQSLNPSRADVNAGLRIRFDQNKAMWWKAREKSSAQLEGREYWSYTLSYPRKVLRSLLKSRSVAVELRSTYGSFLRSNFRISGLSSAVLGLKNAGCSW
jgi:hypothetical protein